MLNIVKCISILENTLQYSDKIGNVKIGAMILFRNKIISIGIACRKTHPLQKKYSKNANSIFLHAEINAIRKALCHISVNDLPKSTLVVCRIKKHDIDGIKKIGYGLAKPCIGCERAIVEFEIKNVIYTIDNFELITKKL